ncbi:SDR family NAD(P)-dependent oxidoreductase [Saccharopolyspora sp. 5N708]|uniref:SDR family NAD(P)-dependent oxidoreductase n=1 Tax=Saccharopolyspora sp. 5N708 TaxID=3457424 RepID=UPI003FCF0BF6
MISDGSNTDSGERAAAEIKASTGRDDVQVAHVDLADRSTIDAFVTGWSGPLDVLVNNAGIMALPELTRTPEGWEAQFATNHLGHAALTLGLHDALAAAQGARVVVVSSSAHLMAPVDFDDIHFDSRAYEAWSAYGQSKTATILFTVAMAKKWAADDITANALHPGGIMTNLQRHLDETQLRFVGAMDDQGHPLDVPPGWKTPQQGAATSVLLAASPHIQGVTGRYFEDSNEAIVVTEPGNGMSGVAPYALDAKTADRLWDKTIRLLQR